MNLQTGAETIVNTEFASKLFPVNLPTALDRYTAVDVNYNYTGFFLVDYKGPFLTEMVNKKYSSSSYRRKWAFGEGFG
jgi:hypothetical protein